MKVVKMAPVPPGPPVPPCQVSQVVYWNVWTGLDGQQSSVCVCVCVKPVSETHQMHGFCANCPAPGVLIVKMRKRYECLCFSIPPAVCLWNRPKAKQRYQISGADCWAMIQIYPNADSMDSSWRRKLLEKERRCGRRMAQVMCQTCMCAWVQRCW